MDETFSVYYFFLYVYIDYLYRTNYAKIRVFLWKRIFTEFIVYFYNLVHSKISARLSLLSGNTDSSKRLKSEISDTKRASISSFLHILFLVTFLGFKLSGRVILLGCRHLNQDVKLVINLVLLLFSSVYLVLLYLNIDSKFLNTHS